MDEIEKQITADLEKLNNTGTVTGNIRTKVIDKLVQVVDGMDLNPALDKPSLLDAKRGLVDTLLKAVNDADTQHSNSIKLKQRIKIVKDNENTNNAVGKMITDMIKGISSQPLILGGDSRDLEKALDGKVISNEIDILDSELEMNKTTAQDIDI